MAQSRFLLASGNSNRPGFIPYPGSSSAAIRLTAHDIPDRPLRDLRFYLEVDRSTESQDILLGKALAYRDVFADRDPFRVLFVFEGLERLENATAAFSQIHRSLFIVLPLHPALLRQSVEHFVPEHL